MEQRRGGETGGTEEDEERQVEQRRGGETGGTGKDEERLVEQRKRGRETVEPRKGL